MNGFLRSLKFSIVLLGGIYLIAPSSTFASDVDSNTETMQIQVAPQDIVPQFPPVRGGNEITPREPIGGYYYVKRNVTTYNNWGPYQRVSDNMGGGSLGSDITATKSVTYNVETTGDIFGIGYSLGGSISTELGYVGRVAPNRTGYLAHKMYYRVESGTRQKISEISGRVVAENYYTIRFPQYGQFDILYN